MNRQKELKLAGDYIPIEIQGEILKRLPLKSLVRFRCVSKPWDSLIRSSKFIRDYHAFHPQQPHHRLLIRLPWLGGDNHQEKYFSILHDDTFTKKILRKVIIRKKYFSVLYDDTFPKQMLPNIIPMSVRRIEEIMAVCSSHGLFCFYSSFSHTNQSQTKRAVIWNPTIEKSVDIDLPNVLDTQGIYTTVIGFGICPHTSDLKLVRIISHGESNNIAKQVEIFTLKSGSWRSLNSNLLSRKSIVFTHKQVVLDQFIYWLAHEIFYVDGEERYKCLIMSFDMISEELEELHLPESARIQGISLSISKFKESLVVFGTYGYDLPVWIMQNGDPKSFKLLFKIDRGDIFISDVLGFTESGQPIIVTKEFQQKRSSVVVEVYKLFVYEPNTKRIKPTGITGALDNSFSECSYAETLLLLDQ